MRTMLSKRTPKTPATRISAIVTISSVLVAVPISVRPRCVYVFLVYGSLGWGGTLLPRLAGRSPAMLGLLSGFLEEAVSNALFDLSSPRLRAASSRFHFDTSAMVREKRGGDSGRWPRTGQQPMWHRDPPIGAGIPIETTKRSTEESPAHPVSPEANWVSRAFFCPRPAGALAMSRP